MAFERIPGGGTIITGERDTKLYRLMALRSALKLEVKGLQMSRGCSAYAIVKAEFGLKGSKAKVLAAFSEIVEKEKKERLAETPA